ncbi:MAG: hypothetical protein LBB67_05135 [Oscillospiraceae bacterium]|jgi:diacylglycerol kinase family enzyme|nr:hypothetical protein [Oscillospiraceae bacterium]
MRHVFVINPFSGKGTETKKLRDTITAVCKEEGVTPEIYDKPGKAEMEKYLRDVAQTGDHVRIYACGGDGTIYCVVNQTFGCKNVEIAAIPYGSGNDFIRLFGKKEELQDIRKHIRGTPYWIDAIECDGEIAVNQCSMGIDAEICAKQVSFKKIPGVSGEFAYTAALLFCLFRKFKNQFTIQVDEHEPVDGLFLFAIGGNSRWYGGGYKGCPLALPDDGLMDCIMVKKAFGRLKLITLIGEYKKGNHLKWDFTQMIRGKRMRIHSDIPAAINVDGECRYVHDSCFELKEKSVCYVIPQGSTYPEDRAAGKLD